MLSSAIIRQQFLDFFASKGHAILPSAPIVVKNDPTLLFTNAGMNQFKDYFLGLSKSPQARVADTQKCLRVSGKHNDLEEVGVDTYHHTMFEMLGNWSFGDPDHPTAGYFKKEAIAWAWELLTEVYQLDKDRLYVTVFEGDPAENLPFDQEAYDEWKKWIDPTRILKGNKKDNFWEMGDTGPCGPCSEIHVDCRPNAEREKIPGSSLVNNDHPQVIEIWNLVFMQFNRIKDGSLLPLPAQHVDTGMGFERLVRVLQGKSSNYDSDVFTHTIAALEELTGQKYDYSDSRTAIAFRVIADHIRAISFTIADGQLPANTGAGYVIRRILRRAVRYYYSYLHTKEPLLYHLVPVISAQFETVFPELSKQSEFVKKVIREEEEAFLRTLEKGLRRMADLMPSTAEQSSSSPSFGIIKGSDAFELYDTYGFPLDLTSLIASENQYTVDTVGFEKEMEQQKQRSRAASIMDTGDWTILHDSPVEFVGYTTTSTPAKILRYRAFKSKGKEGYQMVLSKCPFYAESGGQVGDTGYLKWANQTIEVLDTKKENDLIVVFTKELPNQPSEELVAEVTSGRRLGITQHHTATHLLHAALREILGVHVAQKGSLVNEEQLRFDVSHFAKITDEEIEKIENRVNQKIRENIPVIIREMPKEEALKSGAMALFGEKYGETVRVVTIDPSFSVELCGGTHVANTGELGYFAIQAESAVAAGVRRIEAVAGAAAERLMQEMRKTQKEILQVLKQPKDVIKAIEQFQSELSEQKKRVEKLEDELSFALVQELKTAFQPLGTGQILVQEVNALFADALKKIGFELQKGFQKEKMAAVLYAVQQGKVQVVVAVAEEWVASGIEAPKMIKEAIAPLIKGGGGGQKTLATAGGQEAARTAEIEKSVKDWLNAKNG